MILILFADMLFHSYIHKSNDLFVNISDKSYSFHFQFAHLFAFYSLPVESYHLIFHQMMMILENNLDNLISSYWIIVDGSQKKILNVPSIEHLYSLNRGE